MKQAATESGISRLTFMQAILVPVKSFLEAKHRLDPTLDDAARQRLARDLASIVLGARGSAPLFVACDDNAVADWALSEGASVLWTPGLGLSGAVRAGVDYLGREGFERVVVAHADLPFVTDLDRFGLDRSGESDGITIAPDHRLDGTNVISLPTSVPFSFFYGYRSYPKHRAEASRLGLACHTVFDWRLASDIDLPSDLALIPDLLKRKTTI